MNNLPFNTTYNYGYRDGIKDSIKRINDNEQEVKKRIYNLIKEKRPGTCWEFAVDNILIEIFYTINSIAIDVLQQELNKYE